VLVGQIGFSVLLVTMVVGIYAAALGHRWGAYAAVGAFFVRFCGYLVGGIWAYRETMSRPWPKVAPVDDDDDDW
jgi:hypothetical protein